jgi:hypothetical protein
MIEGSFGCYLCNLLGCGLGSCAARVTLEEPLIEIRFELRIARFSVTVFLRSKVSMKAFTSDQSILLSVLMKRLSLEALNGVIRSGGRKASRVPIIASGVGT